MTSRTHDLAAFTALNLAFIVQKPENLSFPTALASIIACFLGGLAPDLDKPTSDFWDKLPGGFFLGRILQPFFGKHRHLSHSILGIILFGLGVNYILDLAKNIILVNMDIVWIAFMIGLASHLIMDSFTTEGVPWFFPIPLHFGIPPFKILRIKTGGIMEKLVVFSGLLILNAYLFYNFYPIYLNLIRHFVK